MGAIVKTKLTESEIAELQTLYKDCIERSNYLKALVDKTYDNITRDMCLRDYGYCKGSAFILKTVFGPMVTEKAKDISYKKCKYYREGDMCYKDSEPDELNPSKHWCKQCMLAYDLDDMCWNGNIESL